MTPTIIPIAPDPEGQVVESAMRIKLTRRELLKGTGVLTGTLALSSTLAMFAPSRVWALELQGLNTHQGDVLLAFTRQLYPHATLDNAVYALVVKDLDGKAQKDPAVRQQLVDGVKQLDATAALNGITEPIVCTDPPYYDNVGYADLSDFFYIWLRRSLGKIYPDLFSTVLTPKAQELIAAPYRFDGEKIAGRETA